LTCAIDVVPQPAGVSGYLACHFWRHAAAHAIIDAQQTSAATATSVANKSRKGGR